jgi:hypothetical protein
MPEFSEDCHQILKDIDNNYQRFGSNGARFQTKATGAVTNEVIRKRLQDEGVNVSLRNVFIEGYPTEWDLIIPKNGAEAELDCIWQPADVLAVLEIKYSGLYDHGAIQRLNQTFFRLTDKHPHIKPYYFTIMETQGACERITDQTIGGRALILHWWRSRNKKDEYLVMGDQWETLVREIKDHIIDSQKSETR